MSSSSDGGPSVMVSDEIDEGAGHRFWITNWREDRRIAVCVVRNAGYVGAQQRRAARHCLRRGQRPPLGVARAEKYCRCVVQPPELVYRRTQVPGRAFGSCAAWISREDVQL